MLTILLFYTALPIVFTLIRLLTTKAKISSVVSLALVEILAFVLIYFGLPSKNALSIVWGNFVYGLIYSSGFHAFSEDFSDSSTKIWFVEVGAVGLLFGAGLVGSAHSHMSVKPMWNSIDKTYSKSTEAPTFKRGETPIALAPKTVLNRVRKASSDMPNAQYYSISSQVQAQFVKGKPVYVVPVEYNGFWQMHSAGKIPGYFVIDATRQSATPKFVHKAYTYATSAYFGKDASRQIYRHVPEWLELGDPQLEVDDNGNPYWVQTIYKPEFFSHRINYSELHVAVLDAKTGDVKVYSVDSMPKFIDEGITTEAANQMNWNFGKYKYECPPGETIIFSETAIETKDGNLPYDEIFYYI